MAPKSDYLLAKRDFLLPLASEIALFPGLITTNLNTENTSNQNCKIYRGTKVDLLYAFLLRDQVASAA